MIFTVVMSIWNISSKGMSKSYNLFVSENVIFWGIAFGFGYAGSVTMLAVGLSGDITRKEIGEISLTALDLVDKVPIAFNQMNPL